ncbi:unnamed protein product [Tuber melanosporum]|uniref:Hsp90 chaperone protein kinase-targeting subunit n=1 Tax=Tuber melanosporum (strain Mel28) TaxID=656061 RepID=D5GLL6_TUBMM|nr:uncharacterized protein GSTUM_00010261001 [Tuber melanosporum]CAZ85409.1 unnamed protein product [Tuber melanosporum]
MVLDYSKWDNIELSDDSDIEVHPNVDKRSFINAKRRQIHEQRAMRKQQITNLRTERSMNNALLSRVSQLISTLDAGSKGSKSPEEIVFQSLMDISSADNNPQEFTPPEGAPSYAQMMASLVDSIKKEIDEENPDDRWTSFLNKLKEHKVKLTGVYEDSGKRLADLEKEDNAKITSDSIHDGFSSGHVTKESPLPKKEPAKKTQKVQAVEQLNPGVKAKGPLATDPPSDADAEEGGDEADEDEDHIEPTALGREFSHIKMGDYRACMEFISRNSAVVAEKETDGLLIEAFNSQIAGKEDYAKQCVHQALLLQYCRQLGRDGIALFFRRITTPNHQAQKVFHEDVTTTYARIRERAAAIATESSNENAEQIQLHAVDPNTQISIAVPSVDSEDPDIQKSRTIFESFPPGLQRALGSGSLDEVNKVLGKMSVEEAEEVVGQLGEGGMLSLEPQIIDATTQEGQQVLRKIEEEERAAKANASSSPDITETDRKGKGISKEEKGKEEEALKEEDLANEID